MTFWQELSKVKNARRRVYFQWKNGISNIKVDYSSLTQDEFIVQCNKLKPVTNAEEFINYCKKWESSAEYKRLLFLLKEDNFYSDIAEIYDATKEKAIEGDSQAIKNVIMLQDEITKYRKSIDKFNQLEEIEEEDDGLVI